MRCCALLFALALCVQSYTRSLRCRHRPAVTVSMQLPLTSRTTTIAAAAHAARPMQRRKSSSALRAKGDDAPDSEGTDGQNEGGGKQAKKSTMFERSLDDFIGKRYGAGEAFYGRRKSDLTEEEFSAYEKPKMFEAAPLRPNSILVLGSMDSIGQWVAYDLVEKGFSVRVCSLYKQETTDVFGLPGKNVDMVELRGGMDQAAFYGALAGVQAVVLCSNFEQTSRGSDEVFVAKELLRCVKQMAKGRMNNGGLGLGIPKLDVKKIVAISRVVPWSDAASKKAFSLDSLLDLFARKTNAADPQFAAQHASVEKDVRALEGIEYVIVRAPPLIDPSREGSSEDLLLLQGEEGGKTTTSDVSRRIAAVAGDAGGLSIGQLDLAECAVQALIQDISGTTFTPCSDPRAAFDANRDNRPLAQSNAMEAIYGPPPPKRARGSERKPRYSYYSILDMVDSDMKASYLLRPAELVKQELMEDAEVEDYWLSKLEVLAKDLL